MEKEYSEIRRQLKKYGNVQSLMRYINKDSLKRKSKEQLGGKATGIDNITKYAYEKNLDENIDNLLKDMKALRYKPKPVKRVYIPKLNGKKRPLGIPCYEDKLVQGVMADILNEIYEPIFLDCSFGFRENRDCHQAIKALDTAIMRGKTNYIVEADIKGFFDNIDHKWLIKMLELTIEDKKFIRYIVRFLKAGIMEDMKYMESKTGTPQGGLISPILANVFLHYVLDLWFEKHVKKVCKGKCHLIRYADDFVVCFEFETEAKEFYEALIKRFGKFGLELETSKTKIFPFGRNSNTRDSFDFLGFNIYNAKTRKGHYRVGYKTSNKKAKAKKENIKEYIKLNRDAKPRDIIKGLNRILIGYYNYYGISFNRWIYKIYDYTIIQLKKWLSRRSQRGKITWEKTKRILKYSPLVKPERTYSLF